MSEARTLYDGFGPVPEGVDTATPPELPVMAQRTARAINVSHRGGYVHPRPGWRRLDFDLDRIDVEAAREAVDRGLFQGAAVFYPQTGAPEIILGVGGWNYALPLDSLSMRLISPDKKPWRSAHEDWWAVQAERWMIIQNGRDAPIIYDGANSRRPGVDEIRTGTAMCYAWGRIWYATPDRYGYRVTDLVWENGNREDVLKETGNKFLTGADFQAPTSLGKIVAIVAPAVLDSALGHGPVHVFCENGVFTNNAPVERDVWLNLEHPIQTITLMSQGLVSPDAIATVNSDIFFRGRQGIESYFLARRDFTGWGNREVSREVGNWFKLDVAGMLHKVSMVHWNNRLLCTVLPARDASCGLYHRALVVLDFDVLATLKGEAQPAWDGLWKGPPVHKLLTVDDGGRRRLFAIGRAFEKEASGRWPLRIYEMHEDHDSDLDGSLSASQARAIKWLIESRQFNFGSPYVIKRLEGAELFLDQVRGEVAFDVNLRSDDSVLEFDWANWKDCAPICTQLEPGTCGPVETLQPQYRTRVRLPQPPEDCIPPIGRPARLGHKFSVVIRGSGQARIKGMVLRAIAVPEPTELACADLPCVPQAGCIDPLADL